MASWLIALTIGCYAYAGVEQAWRGHYANAGMWLSYAVANGFALKALIK